MIEPLYVLVIKKLINSLSLDHQEDVYDSLIDKLYTIKGSIRNFYSDEDDKDDENNRNRHQRITLNIFSDNLDKILMKISRNEIVRYNGLLYNYNDDFKITKNMIPCEICKIMNCIHISTYGGTCIICNIKCDKHKNYEDLSDNDWIEVTKKLISCKVIKINKIEDIIY
jgi:hypothetical protein